MRNYNQEQLEALQKAQKLLGDELTLTTDQAEALKEYEEVQNLPWDKAVENCKFMMGEALLIGPAGFFYVHGCKEMLEKYEAGVRTRELYDEMINLH